MHDLKTFCTADDPRQPCTHIPHARVLKLVSAHGSFTKHLPVVQTSIFYPCGHGRCTQVCLCKASAHSASSAHGHA
jgi:hypothetical protein